MGMPSTSSETKYGSMNAPPPFCAAVPGNRRKLPSPTAEPATARITPIREPHCSRFRCSVTVKPPFGCCRVTSITALGVSRDYSGQSPEKTSAAGPVM